MLWLQYAGMHQQCSNQCRDEYCNYLLTRMKLIKWKRVRNVVNNMQNVFKGLLCNFVTVLILKFPLNLLLMSAVRWEEILAFWGNYWICCGAR